MKKNKVNNVRDIAFTNRLFMVKGKLTLRAFAAKIEMKGSTVYNYLNGREPKAGFIRKVCTAFQVSPWWLLTGQGNYGMTCDEEERPKACPFCGSKETRSLQTTSPYYISCTNCGANGTACEDLDQAILDWNRRV